MVKAQPPAGSNKTWLESSATAWNPGRLAALISLLLVLAGPIILGFVAVGLGQDINWDLQNYHLYSAYAWINDRLQLDLAPAGLQSYFNPFLDLAWFWLSSHLQPQSVAFIVGLVQGFNLVLLFFICRKVLISLGLSPLYSLLLAIPGILSVGFLSEIGSSMNDSVVSLFLLAALLIILHGLDRQAPAQRKFLLVALAGLVAGLGTGLKLVVGTNTLALCLAFFVLAQPWRINFLQALVFGLAVLAGFLLIDGYWLYRIWSEFGNPLFPQFNHIFQGELAEPRAFRDERFLPYSLVEKLLYPFLFSLEPGRVSEFAYQQWAWPLIYVCILLFGLHRLVLKLSRQCTEPLSAQVRFVLAYFCFSYLFWLHLFGVYRYLIALELLLPLLFFVLMHAMIQSWPARLGALALLAWLSWYNLSGIPDWGHADWAPEQFSVDRPADLERVSTVVLMGQPLAWLVPALDLEVPFIQGYPNFRITEQYRQRVLELLDPSGRIKVIFDPGVIDWELTQRRLNSMNYLLQRESCEPLTAYLGSARLTYQYCSVEKAPR